MLIQLNAVKPFYFVRTAIFKLNRSFQSQRNALDYLKKIKLKDPKLDPQLIFEGKRIK